MLPLRPLRPVRAGGIVYGTARLPPSGPRHAYSITRAPRGTVRHGTSGVNDGSDGLLVRGAMDTVKERSSAVPLADSPLGRTIATSATDIWNDSCAVGELEYEISSG